MGNQDSAFCVSLRIQFSKVLGIISFLSWRTSASLRIPSKWSLYFLEWTKSRYQGINKVPRMSAVCHHRWY